MREVKLINYIAYIRRQGKRNMNTNITRKDNDKKTVYHYFESSNNKDN